jgi:hypothetical protein
MDDVFNGGLEIYRQDFIIFICNRDVADLHRRNRSVQYMLQCVAPEFRSVGTARRGCGDQCLSSYFSAEFLPTVVRHTLRESDAHSNSGCYLWFKQFFTLSKRTSPNVEVMSFLIRSQWTYNYYCMILKFSRSWIWRLLSSAMCTPVSSPLCSDDRGSRYLRNASNFVPDYKASYLKRQSSGFCSVLVSSSLRLKVSNVKENSLFRNNSQHPLIDDLIRWHSFGMSKRSSFPSQSTIYVQCPHIDCICKFIHVFQPLWQCDSATLSVFIVLNHSFQRF